MIGILVQSTFRIIRWLLVEIGLDCLVVVHTINNQRNIPRAIIMVTAQTFNGFRLNVDTKYVSFGTTNDSPRHATILDIGFI